MNKAHSPINWENYPSEKTPINESNLNKMDRAIGIIDDRVVELDNTKASKDDVSTVISNVEYDEQGLALEFTRKNGDVKKISISNDIVDNVLSETSTNPVQNKVVTKEIRQLSEEIVETDNFVFDNVLFDTYKESDITNSVRGDYGYYRYTDGVLVDEQFNATVKFPVNYNDCFVISGTYGYASCLVAEFDENGGFIKPHLYNTDKAITVNDYIYFVPKGVSIIGISSISNTFKIVKRNYDTVKEKINQMENNNYLYGKKWVACGDSYTKGDFTGYVDSNGKSGVESDAYDSERGMYKTYPWWIAKRNGMNLVNEAICGSTLAYPKSGEPTETNAFSYERYKNIPTDADYITLWFGINDAAHCELGNVTDGGTATFCGALGTVLYYLMTKHTKAKIGVIVTNRSTAEFRQATRDVCDRFGIPYLDMMGDKKIPPIFGREESLGMVKNITGTRNNQFVVSSTNSHPNLWAHKYQSTFIENWLRSL